MSIKGTVIRGTIVLDGGVLLPEGTRVRVELANDDGDGPILPSTETREEVLESLRQSD